MSTFSAVMRLGQIAQVVWRERLDAHFFRNRWRRNVDVNDRGRALRQGLTQLGPVFVKFGQMLSTRPDLLPADISAHLAKLQDQVPPFSGELAKQQIEQAFDAPLTHWFSEFDLQPLAAASVAQVHCARLHDGREVVVKVLRPDVHETIAKDMALLKLLAWCTHQLWRAGRMLRPMEVVAEFNKTLNNELDLLREGANAAVLRKNFLDSDLLYVPEVHWPMAHERVLVLERIKGVSVGDINALKAANANLEVLGRKGVETFFTQVFRDNFFHADMHPGNIFVDLSTPQNPSYIAVDFGIVGSLTDADREYLAQNLLAFFQRDYRRVAQLHIDSGWVPAETSVEDFTAAIRVIAEPIFGRPLAEISFGVILMRLFQVARQFQMIVQPQLVLLQKTLLNIEGLGRTLYPQLDLWQTAKPFLEKWMSEQKGWRALQRSIMAEAPQWSQTLPQLPRLARESMHDLHIIAQHVQEQKERAGSSPWTVATKLLFLAVVVGALLVSEELTAREVGLLVLGGCAGVLLWSMRK